MDALPISYAYAIRQQPSGGAFVRMQATAFIPRAGEAEVLASGTFLTEDGPQRRTYYRTRSGVFFTEDESNDRLSGSDVEKLQEIMLWTRTPPDGAAGHPFCSRHLRQFDDYWTSDFNRMIPPGWVWDFSADDLGRILHSKACSFYGRTSDPPDILDADDLVLAEAPAPEPDLAFEAMIQETMARRLAVIGDRVVIAGSAPSWSVSVGTDRVRIDLRAGTPLTTRGDYELRFAVDQLPLARSVATSIAATLGQDEVKIRGDLASFCETQDTSLVEESLSNLRRRTQFYPLDRFGSPASLARVDAAQDHEKGSQPWCEAMWQALRAHPERHHPHHMESQRRIAFVTALHAGYRALDSLQSQVAVTPTPGP